MAAKRKVSVEAIAIVSLALAVVFWKQWWRISHRLGYPMFSAQVASALAPYLLMGGIVLLFAVAYWAVQAKKGDDEHGPEA